MSRKTILSLSLMIVSSRCFSTATDGNAEMETKAASDAISYLEWKRVNIIFDNQYVRMMNNLSATLNEMMVFASYKNVEVKRGVNVNERNEQSPQNYVILCTNLKGLFEFYVPDIFSIGDLWLFIENTKNQIMEGTWLEKIRGQIIIVNTTGNIVQMTRRRRSDNSQEVVRKWTIGKPPKEAPERLDQKLNGIHFRIGYGENPPHFIMSQENGKPKLKGYIGEMLDVLSERMNFTYELFLQMKYGKYYENGTWDGLIGKLAEKELDIMPILLIGDAYWKLVEYAIVIGHIKRVIVARKPSMQYAAVFNISRTTNLLLLVLCMWIIAAIVLMAINKFMGNINQDGAAVSFPLALFGVWGLLTNSDSNISTRSYSARILIFAVSVMAIILAGCYCSDIASVSVAGSSSLPFRNLEELLKRRDYKMGPAKQTPYLQMLMAAKTGSDKIVADRIRKDPSVIMNSHADGIEKAYNEKYCYIGGDSVMQYMLKNNCSFYTISMDKTFIPIYLATTREFVYKRHIAWHLQKMKESGILDYLWMKYTGSKTLTCSSRTVEWQPLSLTHLLFCFIILFSGIALSLILVFFQRKSMEKKNHQSGHSSKAYHNKAHKAKQERIQISGL